MSPMPSRDSRIHASTESWYAGVYVPAEDTLALARALRAFQGDTWLEIGFGSGAILSSIAPRFRLVVGTDVLTHDQASRVPREGQEVVLADRASCFRNGVFDLVAFNPPYLPSEGIRDRTVDGGRGGIEVPLSFLDEATRVLKPEGRILLLMSDEADLEGFKAACEARGLRVAEKERTPLFYENLVVFELQRL